MKYLRVETKGRKYNDIVAQVDVNNLNKKGINAEWDKLDKKYVKEHFSTGLITLDRELRIFADEPEKWL